MQLVTIKWNKKYLETRINTERTRFINCFTNLILLKYLLILIFSSIAPLYIFSRTYARQTSSGNRKAKKQTRSLQSKIPDIYFEYFCTHAKNWPVFYFLRNLWQSSVIRYLRNLCGRPVRRFSDR